MADRFPADLNGIALEDGTIAVKVLREMIFYKSGFTVEEHDALIELYLRHCPPGRNRLFKIPELSWWSSVADPALTMSARRVRGRPLAQFEAVRRRIAERRWFFSKLWDGLKIDDPAGSWSLDIQHRRNADHGWDGYVRFLMPIDLPDAAHLALARDVIEAVPFVSGHGGPCFAYLPDRKSVAFDLIYARSRRFRGIDIEDLPITLPHMKTQLKPPCWLNVIGRDPVWDTELWRRICALPQTSGARVSHAHFGLMVQLSDTPDLFDGNRRDDPPAAYGQYDATIAEVRLRDIGSFSGRRFHENPDATPQWLSRYSPQTAG